MKIKIILSWFGEKTIKIGSNMTKIKNVLHQKKCHFFLQTSHVIVWWYLLFHHDNANSLEFFFVLLTSCVFHAPAYSLLCMHFTYIMRDAIFTVHPSYIFEGCNNYPHLYLRDVIITLHPSYIFEGCINYFTSLIYISIQSKSISRFSAVVEKRGTFCLTWFKLLEKGNPKTQGRFELTTSW